MDENRKLGLASYALPEFAEVTTEITAARKAWKSFGALVAEECLNARGRAYGKALFVRKISTFGYICKSFRDGSWLGILYFFAFAFCLHGISAEDVTLRFVLILAGCQFLFGLATAVFLAAQDRAAAERVYADSYFEAEWLLTRVAAAIPPVAERFFTDLSKEATGHSTMSLGERKRALSTLEQGTAELRQAISVYEKLVSWRNVGASSVEEQWRQTMGVRFFCQQLFLLKNKIRLQEYP